MNDSYHPPETHEGSHEIDDAGEKTPGNLVVLVFLTLLGLFLGGGLFALPFFWGIKGSPVEMVPDPSVLNDWLRWMGDMHLLVLHIPIGIFSFALGAELIGLLTFRKFKPHLGLALGMASASGVLAVVFGYFLFLQGDYGSAAFSIDFEEDKMGVHLWFTMLFVFFTILAFLSKLWSRRANRSSPFYPFFMFFAAVALGIGAHAGGEKVHPDKDMVGDFVKLVQGESLAGDAVVFSQSYLEKTAEERLIYSEVVQPILEGKCYECHAPADKNPLGRDKIKGKLDMTSVEGLLIGGRSQEDFPNIVPGDAEDSELLIRTELDPDDEEFMPTGKEDEVEMHLTDGEKRILSFWINLKSDDLVENQIVDAAAQERLLTDEILNEEQLASLLERGQVIGRSNDLPLKELPDYDSVLTDVEEFEPINWVARRSEKEAVPESETNATMPVVEEPEVSSGDSELLEDEEGAQEGELIDSDESNSDSVD